MSIWKGHRPEIGECPFISWSYLVELSRFHTVTWMKVRGHAGIGANEHCDALVRLEMARGKG
jgi:ribonuclease HI